MNMIDEKILSELRTRLLERRREMVERREDVSRSWQELNTPEKEPEETAGKGALARGLEQLDSRGNETIHRINDALGKMDEGTYGTCEACSKPIAVKRLQATPEARHCVRCARAREDFDRGPLESPPVAVDEQELTDSEMEEAIDDALTEDGRVETQELEFRCSQGIVYLDGILPSEREHEMLISVITERLGFSEVVDEVSIDRQPWERRERDRRPVRKKEDKDIRMEGEDRAVDLDESLETGEPMTPPDRMKPEKE